MLGRLVTNVLVGLLALLVLAIGLVLKPSLLPTGVRESFGLAQHRTNVLSPPSGSYDFMNIQPGTHDMPVTYDRCQTLHYVINFSGAPARFSDGQFIFDAVKEVSQVSGLKFHYDGPSDRRRLTRSYEQGPILFSFDVVADDKALDGAAAIGGSGTITRAGRTWYSTGAVTFERDYFQLISTRSTGDVEAKAIALHELGHVLGLNHVQDPRELMYPSGSGGRDFGPGDRTGLKILGSGPCY